MFHLRRNAESFPKKQQGTVAMQIVCLCESFGTERGLHDAGVPNLCGLGAMEIPGKYFRRGLLQPGYDFEASRPWLENPPSLDENGVVRAPDDPGPGYEFDREFVEANRADAS